MELLPALVIRNIACHLVAISDAHPAGAFMQPMRSPERCLSGLSNLARTSRRLYAQCNPLLYETAVILDLARFRRAPTQHPTVSVLSARTTRAAATSSSPTHAASTATTSTGHPDPPPIESTELALEASTTPLAHGQNAWYQDGAVVMSAAASGNLDLLQRLIYYFPTPRVLDRLPLLSLSLSSSSASSILPPSCAPHLRYLQLEYYVPLPCASHFAWRRCANSSSVSGTDSAVDGDSNLANLPQSQGLMPPLAAAAGCPLHAAAAAGHEDIVTWLLDHGAAIEQPAYNYCQCASPHMRLLLEYALPRDDAYVGAWPSEENPESCMAFFETPAATPLHLALSQGHESTARLLISRGAIWDRPLVGSYGITALHIMAAAGMVDMINWLRSGHCTETERNHDWPDDSGLSALHYAAATAFHPGHPFANGRLAERAGASEAGFPGPHAASLVNALLHLGVVALPSVSLRRLVQLERQHLRRLLLDQIATSAPRDPNDRHATTAMSSRPVGHVSPPFCQSSSWDAADLEHQRDWIWRLHELAEMAEVMEQPCPLSFAIQVGNESLAAALSEHYAESRSDG